MERLQKKMARCGVASRRKAEEMILAGRVKVNNKVITELGYKIGEHEEIKVDEIILQEEVKKYYCLNKPRYIISSVNDEHNRQTVIDILPDTLKRERLFPIGRLDYDTKGVLLITNDGEFMNTLVGPNSGIEKEYLARVSGIANTTNLKPLATGVVIDGKMTLPALFRIESVDRDNKSSLIRIIVTEGRFHQVKQMLESVGYPVKKLTRVRFGCIEIGHLREGDVRPLTIHEVKTLIELSKQSRVLR